MLQKEREKDCSSALLCLSVNNSRFRVIHTKSLVHFKKKIILETLLIIFKNFFLSLWVSSTPFLVYFLAHKLLILVSLLDLLENIYILLNCCSDQADSFDLGNIEKSPTDFFFKILFMAMVSFELNIQKPSPFKHLNYHTKICMTLPLCFVLKTLC